MYECINSRALTRPISMTRHCHRHYHHNYKTLSESLSLTIRFDSRAQQTQCYMSRICQL